MKFHKEGYATLLIAILFSTIIISIAKLVFPEFSIAHWFAYLLSGFLLIVVIQFFRHPTREHMLHDNSIIAPADGKVVVIEEVEEPEYFKDKRIQVSIFMSPINVHVNRYPIAGEVTYAKYHAGKFLVASLPKASTENERTTIVVKHPVNGKSILFRQVAGALARRIVMYSKQGDQAVQCGEMGFIKFGSRVDLYLPLDAKLKVKIGDVVTGSQSVIAEF
ncbi:MAG: phosphatidylserine decarboxylase precursor-related protein [Bacteroidetes bacterium]|jgi:phosphatidylserine decarboxylase|nr:phosphatidylserine decarboxylase precursor-related protein [Bacteroidota bacterium]MDF2451184.1 phosphatidylserine decarboxylase precursor-related protein [Bacteroidota bacterium]